ncbi:MAG: hypothetical protein RIT23_580, partial [Actinomycetota bacterium]
VLHKDGETFTSAEVWPPPSLA